MSPFLQRSAGYRRILVFADSTRSKIIWEDGIWNPRNSQTGSSLCQCSTTSIGQAKEMMEFVFRIQKKSRNTRKDSRKDPGRFCPGDEKKWYGTLLAHLNEYGIYSHSDGGTIQRYRSSSIQEHQSFESWNSEKEEWQRYHALQCDASNTELYSVNQLSIYGAVANWCEQFGLTEEEKGKERPKESVTKRCIVKCEFLRSKTFGITSKASIWKQFATKHSGLPIADRDNSIHKVCELALFLARGICWDELQNSTWRGRRFWADHSTMQGISRFLEWTHNLEPLQQFLEEQYWTSHWNPDREKSWPIWLEIPSPTDKERTSYVLVSRGKSRLVDEFHISMP